MLYRKQRQELAGQMLNTDAIVESLHVDWYLVKTSQ